MTDDLFGFINRINAVKKELDIELFVFNKNYTPYSLNWSDSVAHQLRPVFLHGLLGTVQLGAGTGMQVRSLEEYEKGENMVAHAPLEDIGRAETLLHLIKHERGDIVAFNTDENELKRMKGIVGRFTHEDGKEFYVVKALPSGSIDRNYGMQINKGKLEALEPDVVFKVPLDEQVLIAGDDVYVFNMAKFIKLFEHDATQDVLLANKIAEIESTFDLNYPEGLNLSALAKSKKMLAEKLLRVNPRQFSLEQILEQADKFGLALMTDDAGRIIIMDARDATIFADLLNDEYVDSDMSGRHYRALKKEVVEDIDDKQINFGV